ncbi:MAG: hypothetical protein KAT25_04350 [Sulfuriflexus sp.]|nr:hypothetical protein [Sulfuriflexus sp.]
MRTFWSILLLFIAASSQAVEPAPTATFIESSPASSQQLLSAELWARPRSGASVAAMPAVRESVRTLLAAPAGSKLVIRYPGGEEGSLWAEELHVWLISLGIDTELMDLRPGSAEPDQIELYIE